MEAAFLEPFANFGAVALITGAMLIMNYRHQAQMAERLARQEKRAEERMARMDSELLNVVRHNSQAMVRLSTAVDRVIGMHTGKVTVSSRVDDGDTGGAAW